MLWLLFFILLLFWALGFFTGTMGNFVHLFLVFALIVLIYEFVT